MRFRSRAGRPDRDESHAIAAVSGCAPNRAMYPRPHDLPPQVTWQWLDQCPARTGEKDPLHHAGLANRRWRDQPTPKIAMKTRPAMTCPAIPSRNKRHINAGTKAIIVVTIGERMLLHGLRHRKTRRKTP